MRLTKSGASQNAQVVMTRRHVKSGQAFASASIMSAGGALVIALRTWTAVGGTAEPSTVVRLVLADRLGARGPP